MKIGDLLQEVGGTGGEPAQVGEAFEVIPRGFSVTQPLEFVREMTQTQSLET